MNLSQHHTINLDKTEKYILSLRLSPASLEFSLHDPLADGSFYFQHESFSGNESYLQQLEKSIYENDFLLKEYRKTYIIFSTDRFTLIPATFAEGERTRAYYDFCLEKRDETLQSNKLIRNSCYNLFGTDPDVSAFFQRTFYAPVFIHHISPLCEYFHNKSRFGNFSKMYVQIQPEFIDILAFNQQGLIFVQTYPCHHTNDAVYFILNAWKQLGFDQQKDELQITGTAHARKEIVEILKKYVINVVPVIFPPRVYELGKDTIQAPFDLIALTLCEL